MQYLLESCIYLLAIMGIIFTTISFLEMVIQKRINNNSYRIFKRNNENNKSIDIIIHTENLTEKEEKELIEKIVQKQKIDLQEIATSIIIQK